MRSALFNINGARPMVNRPVWHDKTAEVLATAARGRAEYLASLPSRCAGVWRPGEWDYDAMGWALYGL